MDDPRRSRLHPLPQYSFVVCWGQLAPPSVPGNNVRGGPTACSVNDIAKVLQQLAVYNSELPDVGHTSRY